jgi:DNA segregation ATPase FtsK/SpoIIIE-like protein
MTPWHCALSIRIIAPIPGTVVVGFEVAIKSCRMFYLPMSYNHTEKFSTIPLVLGKDTAGNCIGDLQNASFADCWFNWAVSQL